MEFTKMESLGNDYIIVNNMSNNIEYLKYNKKLIKKLSDRNFGIGFNGIIFLEKSRTCDFKIDIYNRDGTICKTSGNALIIATKYLIENSLISKDEITIETYRSNNIKISDKILVNLGKPSLNPKRIPIITDKNIFLNENIKICKNNYLVSSVTVGNPHVIFFNKNIDDIDLNVVGPYFNYYYKFPEKINIVLAEIKNKKIKIRLYERGVGETRGCVTASASAAVASIYNNIYKTNEIIKVVQEGGILDVSYDGSDVIIGGDADKIFDGKILLK